MRLLEKGAIDMCGGAKAAVPVPPVADMDARPRTLALYRNAEPEPLGTVAGFGAEAYVCAAYISSPSISCDELVLSFGGGPV